MSRDPQLPLFDELGPVPAPDPELVALAERLPRHVRLGTSSWTFEGWKGIVYRRNYRDHAQFVHRSLEEYAAHPLFSTVCIDRSFYAPLKEDEAHEYAQQLPPGFSCVSKVWSELSTLVFPDIDRYGDRAGRDNPAFLDVDVFVEQVLDPMQRGLGGAAGPFLFEVPPAARVEAERLETELARFLRDAPEGPSYVFELRDRRLLSRRYFELLADYGATHVFNYHPRMPRIVEQARWPRALDGVAFVARLMLPPGGRYAELRDAYTPFDRIVHPRPELRADVVELARMVADAGAELYVIVNNKVEGSSPLTVVELARRLAD